jgi:branched-chain amino acid transport system substrate-binding protein
MANQLEKSLDQKCFDVLRLAPPVRVPRTLLPCSRGGMLAIMFGTILTSPARADITIGVAGPMSGQYAIFGEQMVHGAQAAIDAINAKGGISGEQLVLDVGDDACDNRKTEEIAKGFVADGAAVVIGHFCSNAALIGAKIYEAANVPMISSSASLPSLADGAGWNVIRIASRDDMQAEVAAIRIARETPDAKVALIDDGSAAGLALTNRFASTYGKAPALAARIKTEAKDFSGLILELQKSGANNAYLACSASDAGNIAAAIKSKGLNIKLYGADSLITEQYWTSAAEAGKNTRATFATDPQAVRQAKQVIDALKIAGFNGDGATLPSYAAVQLFAAAAVQVGAHNGKGIAEYLRSGKSTETVLGPLAFDAKGEVQPPRFVWYKWSQGAFGAESSNN